MNTEMYNAPTDLPFNLFELKLGNEIRYCTHLYNGCWGELSEQIVVAKIEKNSFDVQNHSNFRDLAESSFQHLVRPIELIEGNRYMYILFEYYKPLLEVLSEHRANEIYEKIFSRLYASVFALLNKSAEFESMKVLLEYIWVDEHNSPHILFYPALTTNTTYSDRYNFRRNVLFELGCVGYFILRRQLPEDRNGYKYRLRTLAKSELVFVVDKLLTGSWSRAECEIFAMYVNNPNERALLLRRLDRNCYHRADPKYNDSRWQEKQDFMDSLFDRRIFASDDNSDHWRSVSILYDWESLNMSLDRSGTARRGPETTLTLMDMLRHTIVHCHRDFSSYQAFLVREYPRKDWTFITIGDFMNIIHEHYPTLFVRILDKAMSTLLSSHRKVFNK